MAISQNHIINIQPGVSAPLVIHCSQGDTGTQINLTVVNGDEEFDCSSYACSVHGVRSDGGNWGPITCTVSGSTVCFSLTSAMTAVAGACLAEISVGTVGTANFAMLMENATFGNGVTYSNDVSVYQNILNAVQAGLSLAEAAVTNEKDERIAAVNAEATARQTADNTLQGNINTEASTRAAADSNLQSQINQIVAPSGEAPSAAEVQNARIGADGVTYDTLGTAIRTQVNNLNENLDNIYHKDGEFFDRNQENWEQGGYRDGYPYSKYDSVYAIRMSTNIPIEKGRYKISNKKMTNKPFRIKIWVFDSTGKLIYNSGWKEDDFTFYVFSDDSSYIAHIGHADGTEITVSELKYIFADYTFWKISTLHINDGWKYGTINKDYVETYSNVRLVLENVKVKFGHMYEVSVSDNYRIWAMSLTNDGKRYEVFEYSSKLTIFTRSVSDRLTFVVKNEINDGEFDLEKICFELKDLGIGIFGRGNILETTGVSWKNASYDGSNGEEVVNEYSYQRALSNYIKVWGDTRLTIKTPNNYTVEIASYSNEKKYIGTYIGYIGFNKSIDIGGFDGFVRVLIKNSESSKIDIAQAPYGVVIVEHTYKTTDHEKSTELIVMTHNVGKFGFGVEWGYNKDDYADKLLDWKKQLRQYSPDFLGMQEFIPYFTKKENIDSRRKIFNLAFAKTIGGALEEAVAINVNIISSEVGALNYSDKSSIRPFMHIVAEKNGIRFNLLNVHFSPSNPEARKAQRAELIQYIQNLDNVICTGDFNAVTADDFDDFKSANFNCANCGDFGIFNTYMYEDYPLDNIIVSPNITIASVEKGECLTSDHYPLIAKLIVLV